jgi:cell shape-determining protein MreC
MSAQFYRPQREDRGRSRLTYVTALFVIIFLLDMVAGGRLSSAVRVPASYVYLSFDHVAETVFSSGIFSTRHALERDNAQLRTEFEEYQNKDATYVVMQEENERLRSLVGLSARIPGRAASITSSLSASAYGTFTIDAGIEEGVARGDVVYGPAGFAIGRVADTGPHDALVSQLFSPDASIEAVVDGTLVVLSGVGGGNARGRAPRESSIQVGDVVRAPEVNAPIGIVGHINANPTGADQEIYVRIPTNLQTLTLVYVGRK